MNDIYVFSNKPVSSGFDKLLGRISIKEEISESGCSYKLSPFLSGGRFLFYVSEFVFSAIIHNIVAGRLRTADYIDEISGEKASEFFCRKLSAYFYITGIKEKIHNIITALLDGSNVINIDGVVKFSLRDMSADISAFFDLMFYEYNIQKQYDDFVTLVRNYIELECPREAEMHIVFKKRGFLLYDENKANITYQALKTYKADRSFSKGNPNDFLISSLLYFMPRSIVIHIEGDGELSSIKRIIDTIKAIFEERVITCEFPRCEFCGYEQESDDLSEYICESITYGG